MKIITIAFMLIFSGILSINGQTDNLISNGTFKTLKSWKTNANLSKTGKVTLLPGENGVTVFNPMLDIDGSLYQEMPTNGHEWFYYSLKIKGGGMIKASAGFIAYDKSGQVLKIITPTKIQGQVWNDYSGTFNVPVETKILRVLLSVLNGSCSFSDIIVKKVPGPEIIDPLSSIIEGKGFSVEAINVERPFWELFTDDFNGDGNPEIVGCDVDGIVTVRNQGKPAILTYAAGALVYQFGSADLNNDGVKEILMSSVDPKINVKAIDLSGKVVKTFIDSKGPERIAAADMDGDGKTEVAVSKRNILYASGISGGIILYNSNGEKIWQNEVPLREFHFADILSEPGIELVTGGPQIEFIFYNKEGKTLEKNYIDNISLAHFELADINADGIKHIIASVATAESPGSRVMCIKGKDKVWENIVLRQLGNPENNIAVGDFNTDLPGLEIVTVGPNTIYLYDAKGTLIYQSREVKNWEYWESWMPDGINSLDICFWNENDPHLYLSSSRYRHCAYYKLDFGNKDDLKTYLVPDQEKHLGEIYNDLKKQPAQKSRTNEKIKVFMEMHGFARLSEESLISYRKVMDSLETPNLEYLIQLDFSDLVGVERGIKLTADQIADRARLFEKTGIPFGIRMAKGLQVWTTYEAMIKSKEAAPEMFRFICANENTEIFYSPGYKDWLKWLDKTLDFCAKHDMKMLLKQKHDDWGVFPADPDLADVIFSADHKDIIVPVFSTNQVYQPEIQLGGMLGLKMSGLCKEFGMSTQYWNWHEWGSYPRGIRDVSAYSVCPSDIILRLDLMGIALGATWINVEGGQPYFESDMTKGLVPEAKRHRDLAFELIRKNILTPGATPSNLNKTSVVRSFHTELEKGKAAGKRIAYPYYDRNTEGLRKGFIPARYIFETYSPDAFPWIAYSLAWNAITCFPRTPNGWIPVVPPQAKIPGENHLIYTDGEKILLNNNWENSEKAASYVEKVIKEGADEIVIEAPGTCLILQKDNSEEGIYTAILIDPGYLAPVGVNTVIRSKNAALKKATDLITGESITISGNSCPVNIQPGAFRVIKLELIDKL